MKIVYSFNKTGFEAQCWEREIQGASNKQHEFIPFNHVSYLCPERYSDSVRLDRLYQSRNPALMKMYADFTKCIAETGADAIIVDNCAPYHPDFLKKLAVYKVLYSGDDPGATYMRNIPYLHAYDHVFFVAPSYSPDMDMAEKMRYCGMVNADWLPISVFDFEHDPSKTEATILEGERDIDIIYVGSFFRQKLDVLAKVKKAFGKQFRLHGFFRFKHNLYFNIINGYIQWIRPISFEERLRMYQRAKIGFNIHWNEHGLGNQRLYHLPANGVMQICDCHDYLDRVFELNEEIVGYRSTNELIAKIEYYLKNDEERRRIALNSYRKTMRDYRFITLKHRAAQLIEAGMARVGWQKPCI